MQIKHTRLNIGLLLLASCVSLSAQAHFLWFESTADGRAHLYFGEYSEGLRERSPGQLDEMSGPTVIRSGSILPIKREAAAFGFTTATTAQDCLLAEERAVPVKDWRKAGIGIVKPVFYARSAGNCTAVTAGTGLDVRPTAQTDRFQVSFAGLPLANTDVLAHMAIGWTKTARTDDQGMVTIEFPWRGLYVLEVIHLEATAGEFAGVKFEAIRHRATLSVNNTRGVALP
jgi:hypothetical protein